MGGGKAITCEDNDGWRWSQRKRRARPAFWAVVIYARTRYLSILLLTNRDATYCCAVGGDVERRCAAKSGQTTWMQGKCLLAANSCSPVRTWMPALGSRSEHGFLYLAAVWDD